jgi:hypothetical protein
LTVDARNGPVQQTNPPFIIFLFLLIDATVGRISATRSRQLSTIIKSSSLENIKISDGYIYNPICGFKSVFGTVGAIMKLLRCLAQVILQKG